MTASPAAALDITRGVVPRLLRVPLFYKILIANAAIVLIGTVAGTRLMRVAVDEGDGAMVPWVTALAVAGVLVTILVNALILRVALQPLKLLEQTAGLVQGGDLDSRVPFSPLRDVQLERLTRTFNGMLDTLESYHHRLAALAARALDAEEEERKRIARELHDDTAQSLAALLIRIRLLRSVSDPAERDRVLEEFRVEVGEALERIRRFALGLRPPALDELGLTPALESHVRTVGESMGISIMMEAEPLVGALSHQAELALYRIAQEAISNAVRHADPGRVHVRLGREGDAVVLTVVDNGSGFAMDEVGAGEERGLGLFGMKERANYVGGQVTIDSRPGSGTRIRAVIPTASRSRQLR